MTLLGAFHPSLRFDCFDLHSVMIHHANYSPFCVICCCALIKVSKCEGKDGRGKKIQTPAWAECDASSRVPMEGLAELTSHKRSVWGSYSTLHPRHLSCVQQITLWLQHIFNKYRLPLRPCHRNLNRELKVGRCARAAPGMYGDMDRWARACHTCFCVVLTEINEIDICFLNKERGEAGREIGKDSNIKLICKIGSPALSAPNTP